MIKNKQIISHCVCDSVNNVDELNLENNLAQIHFCLYLCRVYSDIAMPQRKIRLSPLFPFRGNLTSNDLCFK